MFRMISKDSKNDANLLNMKKKSQPVMISQSNDWYKQIQSKPTSVEQSFIESQKLSKKHMAQSTDLRCTE